MELLWKETEILRSQWADPNFLINENKCFQKTHNQGLCLLKKPTKSLRSRSFWKEQLRGLWGVIDLSSRQINFFPYIVSNLIGLALHGLKLIFWLKLVISITPERLPPWFVVPSPKCLKFKQSIRDLCNWCEFCCIPVLNGAFKWLTLMTTGNSRHKKGGLVLVQWQRSSRLSNRNDKQQPWLAQLKWPVHVQKNLWSGIKQWTAALWKPSLTNKWLLKWWPNNEYSWHCTWMKNIHLQAVNCGSLKIKFSTKYLWWEVVEVTESAQQDFNRSDQGESLKC